MPACVRTRERHSDTNPCSGGLNLFVYSTCGAKINFSHSCCSQRARIERNWNFVIAVRKKVFSHVNFPDFKSFLTKITKNCLSLITEIKTEIKKTYLKIICDLWLVFFSQFLSHGWKIINYFWHPLQLFFGKMCMRACVFADRVWIGRGRLTLGGGGALCHRGEPGHTAGRQNPSVRGLPCPFKWPELGTLAVIFKFFYGENCLFLHLLWYESDGG